MEEEKLKKVLKDLEAIRLRCRIIFRLHYSVKPMDEADKKLLEDLLTYLYD